MLAFNVRGVVNTSVVGLFVSAEGPDAVDATAPHAPGFVSLPE